MKIVAYPTCYAKLEIIGAIQTNLPSSRAPLAVLILLTLAVFWPMAQFDFVAWDDLENVASNKDFNPVTVESFQNFWTRPYRNMYIPIAYSTWALIALAARSSAPDPGGITLNPYIFHIANLAVHLLSVLVVYAILRRYIANRWAVCIGALFFAIHPVQVEPVVWITGWRDVLSGLFAFLAILGFLQAANLPHDKTFPPHPFRWGLWGWATCALILSLLSKPASMVVPFMVAAMALLQPGALRRLRWPLLFWCFIALGFAILTTIVQPAGTNLPVPIWARPLVAADALAFYLMQLVVPWHITIDYGRSPTWLIEHGPLWITWIAPVLVLVAVLLVRRKYPVVAIAALIFLVALLPVIGLVNADFQHYSTVADRYLYFALLGPALLLAWLAKKYPSRLAYPLCGLFILLLGVRAYQAVWGWYDSRTLYEHTLTVNPYSLAANNGMGQFAAGEGKYDVANRYYQAALTFSPLDQVTNYNYGNSLLQQGHPHQAIERYKIAIQKIHKSFLYNNYALALMSTGQMQEAMAILHKGIENFPDSAPLYVNLGLMILKNGDTEQAVKLLHKGLSLDPNQVQARQALERIQHDSSTQEPIEH